MIRRSGGSASAAPPQPAKRKPAMTLLLWWPLRRCGCVARTARSDFSRRKPALWLGMRSRTRTRLPKKRHRLRPDRRCTAGFAALSMRGRSRTARPTESRSSPTPGSAGRPAAPEVGLSSPSSAQDNRPQLLDCFWWDPSITGQRACRRARSERPLPPSSDPAGAADQDPKVRAPGSGDPKGRGQLPQRRHTVRSPIRTIHSVTG